MKANLLKLIRSIQSGMWAINQEAAAGYTPQVMSLLKGETPKDDDKFVSVIKVQSMEDDDSYEIEIDSPQSAIDFITSIDQPDSVVILSVKGPILRYDSWCEEGMESKAAQLAACYSNSNISGVILEVDTPGGETQACPVMADAIAARNKPVITLAQGMMCSAGMYITAGCDTIICENEMTILGSIGTMISFVDMRGWKEYEGIKFIEAYATASVDKNKEFRDARNGDVKSMQDRLLNPLNDLFVEYITSNRPKLNKENTLTGRTFLAKDAVANGLADSIGNLNFAINQIKMFNNKFKGLEKFRGQELNSSQVDEVQRILSSAGLKVTLAKSDQSKPASLLMDTQGDEPSIYVYAQEGEDPVGKRCVQADDQGQPTENNVADGDHVLTDGRTLKSSTKDDGMSYVDSISDAATAPGSTAKKPAPAASAKPAPAAAQEEEDDGDDTITALNNKLEQLTQEISSLKSQVVVGKTPPRETGSSTTSAAKQYKKSAIQKKMDELVEKSKK